VAAAPAFAALTPGMLAALVTFAGFPPTAFLPAFFAFFPLAGFPPVLIIDLNDAIRRSHIESIGLESRGWGAGQSECR
jgi:hypothetical protein